MTTFDRVQEFVPPAQGSTLKPTLGGHYYADPGIFREEQEKILESMWMCAVRSGDLKSPGAFRTVQIGRESVLVVRGRDEALRAFLNVCRHRGARLCTEESGQVKRQLVCPYHSWTYSLDGKLVAAPNLGDLKDEKGLGIDRHHYGLIEVALREWLGYAWVCLAPDPPSFDDDVIAVVTDHLGAHENVDHWGVADLELGHREIYDIAANWKHLVENFMECYHCSTIHPELTTVIPEFTKGLAAQLLDGNAGHFGDDIKGFTVDGSAGQARLPGVTDDEDRKYIAVTIRPNVFLNLVPDHVIMLRSYPTAVDRLTIECDWLFAPEAVEHHDLQRSVELFDRVNRQDIAACERTQLSMTSRAYRRGGVLVPAEHHIGEFHDWVLHKIGHPAPQTP